MQLLEFHTILGIIAAAVGIIGFVPYLYEIIKKRIRPHALSWLVWGILQSTVFFADLFKGAGSGAWAIGASAVLCMLAFAISSLKSKIEASKIDAASLLAALSGIALWILTSNPLWSVIIASGVDATGFVPTFMKAYKKPNEDSMTVFAFGALSLLLSIFALQSVSITTILYPATIVVTNLAFVTMLAVRRRQMG